LNAIIRGARGLPVGNGWVLEGARRFDVASGDETTLQRFRFGNGIGAASLHARRVDPNEKSLIPLAVAIADLHAAGRRRRISNRLLAQAVRSAFHRT